jgi:hypothetical protein
METFDKYDDDDDNNDDDGDDSSEMKSSSSGRRGRRSLGMSDADIEKNLLKYMLESHGTALEQNETSPFNILISQLGLTIPDARNKQ